jgi:uncharacterized protein
LKQQLLRFMRLLQQQGVRVSPAESIDALSAVSAIGVESSDLLKETLAMTLAKTAQEEMICKKCFDQFFNGADATQDASQDGSDASIAPELATPSIDDALAAAIADPDNPANALANSPYIEAVLTQNEAEQQAILAEAMGSLPLETMKFFTQKGLFVRRLLDALGEASLRQVLANTAPTDPLRPALEQLQQTLQSQAKSSIERAFELNAAGHHDALMEELLQKTRLNAIERRHADRLKSLIQKLARKLTRKHRKKPKRTRRGQLNMIKTLRKNIPNDGVLLTTYWRRTEKRKPQIMALCDVSGSVSAYAKFLLMLLYYLQDVLPRTRSFAFAHRLGEITQSFQQLPVELAIERANWDFGGATDYGSSLEQFWKLAGKDITPQTTVIILGDARNNYGNPQFDVLQAINDRCRRIIWLNPESKNQWGSGDSEMVRYQRVCESAYECNTLGHLERVIDQLLTLTR